MLKSNDQTDLTDCPDCAIGPFARNNYFTGKLMLADDFETEQRYAIDKLRYHNQRLHGWGVVCGMKVTQHQPGCRNRFICIEPGTAIDCCGREIFVRDTECIDITTFPQVKALAAAAPVIDWGQQPVMLAVCIRYRECATEPVPVLYDDCGCDQDRCAPNRILESYEFDVTVANNLAPGDPCGTPGFKWETTINPGGASRVVVSAGSPKLLYAISATQQTLFQIEAGHYTVTATAGLGGITPRELAVSLDGKFIYVVVPSAPPANGWTLLVIDAMNLGTTLRSMQILNSTVGENIYLATLTGGSLAVLLGTSGTLQVWDPTLNDPVVAVPASITYTVPNVPAVGLVLSDDAKTAYTFTSGNTQITSVDLTAMPTSTATVAVLPAGFTATALRSGGAGKLVAVSNPGALALATTSPPALVGTVSVSTSSITDVIVSSTGRWAYILTNDTIVSVDLNKVGQNPGPQPGTPVPVGAGSEQIVLDASAGVLYVPFLDAKTTQKPGGIAVVDVSETDCDEIPWRSLDRCPDCCEGNCIVLATIPGYLPGNLIEDPVDPPDPNDVANHVSRIDNRTYRRLLPSVQTLYEMIECCECGGGSGQPGPKGDPGAQGPPGPPAAPLKLVQICAINWTHGDTKMSLAKLNKEGLIVAFTDDVMSVGIDVNSFQVFMGQKPSAIRCFCNVQGAVRPGNIRGSPPKCGDTITTFLPLAPGPGVNARAAQFFYGKFIPGDYRVVIKGDFILGATQIVLPDGRTVNPAVDADHMGPGLPARCPTGDGVEGGTFESWFTVVDDSSPTHG